MSIFKNKTSAQPGFLQLVAGDAAIPAGWTAEDTSISSNVEQGCSITDVRVNAGARRISCGLVYIVNTPHDYRDGSALTCETPLVDTDLSEFQDWPCTYNLGVDYDAAQLIGALFVPSHTVGETAVPARLFHVVEAHHNPHGHNHVLVIGMEPDLANTRWLAYDTDTLENSVDNIDFATIGGTKFQTPVRVADENGANKAIVRCTEFGGAGRGWLVFDLDGAALNAHRATGPVSGSSAISFGNSLTIGKVIASGAAGEFLCTAASDDAVRARVGVAFNSALDTVTSTGYLSSVIGVGAGGNVTAAVLPTKAGFTSSYVLASPLGLIEAHVNSASMAGPVSASEVRQVASRHPFDTGTYDTEVARYIDGLGVIQLHDADATYVYANYSQLKAGFRRTIRKD